MRLGRTAEQAWTWMSEGKVREMSESIALERIIESSVSMRDGPELQESGGGRRGYFIEGGHGSTEGPKGLLSMEDVCMTSMVGEVRWVL